MGSIATLKIAVRTLAKSSLEDAKGIRDKAQAIERYYSQIKEAADIQKQAGEIRLRAERRIGELLRATVKVGRKRSHGATILSLKQLRISKTQSSRWQAVASIPESAFEREIASGQVTTKHFVKLAWKQKLRKQRYGPDKGGNIYSCDLAELPVKDGSIDLILTDPPYADLDVYGRLAEFAARKLKPGKLCVAYCGTHNLPRVFELMGEYLKYHWLFCLPAPGPSVTLHHFQIHAKHKVVVAFSAGKAAPHPYIDDLIDGGVREKTLHIWQQSQSESNYFIDNLSMPGDLVCDPFCGSGTVLAAAKQLGRQWIGGDIDAGAAKISRRRLAA